MNKFNTRIQILVLFILGSTVISCSLDPEIDNTYGEEYAFTLPEKAEGLLMNAYSNLPNTIVDDYGGNFLDAATDNAVTNDFNSNIYRMSQGGLTANSNPVSVWGAAYNQFRNVHFFLENGLGPQVNYDITNEENNIRKKRNLKGEAFYLRAWWGFRLLQVYGGKTAEGDALGYPIILSLKSDEEAQDLDTVERNTYKECVAQIEQDLDSAMVYLPLEYAGSDPVTGELQIGRADQQVVAALKARVAVYAASPAYQPDSVTRLTGMGQFSITDQGIFEAQWEQAARAAQEAIDLIGALPGLSEADFNSNNTPDEFIWRSYHRNRSLENQNYPFGEYGQARTGPSQNLVDTFYSENGFPITDTRSGYDPEHPYEHRDPRLYLNVLYNGVELNNSPLQIYEGGKDSRTVYPQNTRTGYYLRKWLSLAPGIIDVENPGNDYHYNPYLRKTEVYLNFAEASNEAFGPNGVGPGMAYSAVDVIKMIRDKAGITDNTYVDEVAAQGKEAFRELVLRERRLELAFENHRYFDMRRWLMPLDEAVRGMRIEQKGEDTYSYTVFEVEERKFSDIKYYYAPLPYEELVKSPKLIDNLGW
ncbi:RagB/SusD family nutrient uptake outer membrane protein [Sinomicrobium soli]|uniref:RagB/SusD family nutrient uptake outer membrane protein n=1 Tax=Sinomicrobium sp. N-1-3-6 TaxID=2219864 RepID=UPI000DCB1EF4|nr:RagB/SusD family nutrient uptake outer membrane protein [Sinomicrobium sp. N-1-3-6]RAV28097.1 RagB/SusD family nutrient uptake outer membrane protein [Sinomicrobium sp. N-1-3-6]